MIVAVVLIHVSKGFGGIVKHGVPYTDTVVAKAEYDRIAALIEKRSERGNDLPKVITLSGVTEFTAPVEDIVTIGYVDFALQNEQLRGLSDAFPHMFKS